MGYSCDTIIRWHECPENSFDRNISKNEVPDISGVKVRSKIIFCDLPNIQIQMTGAVVKIYVGISSRF